MRIRLIIPITSLSNDAIEERLNYLKEIADQGTILEAVQVKVGPPAIESESDAVIAGPDILNLVREAESDGVDAVIIWCGSDPALSAARELVDIPVIGPGESMMALSMTLGCKPIRIVPDMPVLEMRKDINKTVEVLKEQINEYIVVNKGDVFVLGCLALWGLGKMFRDNLKVPVLDGAEASLKMAELLVKLELRHSRITYPKNNRSLL
jgi:allantoin racemase